MFSEGTNGRVEQQNSFQRRDEGKQTLDAASCPGSVGMRRRSGRVEERRIGTPYGISSVYHADQVSCIQSITTKPEKWSILGKKGNITCTGQLRESSCLTKRSLCRNSNRSTRGSAVRVINPHQPSRGDTATERQTGPVHQTAAANGLRPSEDLWLLVLEPEH